ncbi:glycosyltransferase family 4 protein, partial [Vibrio aestuarianus]|uniref:hypothetical protein n=1 Tax=Vibrio aestuarianus TaxID=28171 RepID=UPI001559B872
MKKRIFNARLNFVDRVVSLIKRERNIEQKVQLLLNVNYYLTNNHCGVFRYQPIEDTIQLLGESFRIKKPSTPRRNNFLHVMTKASITGGHTRVVENFIKNRANYNEKHDLVLVSQGDEKIPEFCLKMERNCSLINLSDLNTLEKISKLAGYAQHYEYIILHHHMYDVLPIIALSQFKHRGSIYTYNHADHLYWVGSSIISGSFEMSTDGLIFSKKRRNIKNTLLLPIPLEEKQYSSIDLKLKLDIPEDSKVVLTIGSQDRFVTNGYSYRDMVSDVLKRTDKTYFVIVGRHTEKSWGDLWSHPQLRFPGVVPKEELAVFYSNADIYVDSFPMGGGTATLDALCFNIPAIKVKHIFFEFDSLKPIVINSVDVADNIVKILNGDSLAFSANIDSHYRENFNSIFDKFIRHRREDSCNSGDELVCDFESYDHDLFSYQDNNKKAFNGYL